MDTLYIDRKDTRLDIEAERLIIRVPDQRPTTLPLRQIRLIALSARVDLSTTVLLGLNQHGISLVVVHPFRHDNHLVCGGPSHGNINRRIRQFSTFLDDTVRLQSAREIVSAKLLQQYRALGCHRRRRPDLRRPLIRGMEQIALRWKALGDVRELNSLRGIEGAAAAAYFSALATLFAESLSFSGRKRRPPPDPVNALLSLTYTLVHGEAVRALLAAGLDPHIGALHDPYYNRESLACDLVELFRVRAESWVVDLFRTQTLQAHHFSFPGSGQCLLSKEGRALYFPLYQQASQPWRARLRQTAARWANRLEPDSNSTDMGVDSDDAA